MIGKSINLKRSGLMIDKRQIVVYVAGPYRAFTQREIRDNVSEAIEVASDIRVAGYSAIVPHLESLYNEHCISEADWLEHGLSLLQRCSAVFDFRNGRRSVGTEKEISLACELGIPVFSSICDLNKYFDVPDK
jgi:hypothetical protein